MDRLAGFVKIIDLTLLMESYFNMDSYSEEELWILDVFIPYYIFTFVNVVERTQGDGMKLIKVHILQHLPHLLEYMVAPRILILSYLKVTINQKLKYMHEGQDLNWTDLNGELLKKTMMIVYFMWVLSK